MQRKEDFVEGMMHTIPSIKFSSRSEAPVYNAVLRILQLTADTHTRFGGPILNITNKRTSGSNFSGYKKT